MLYPDWLPDPKRWDAELRFNSAHDKLGKFAPKLGGGGALSIDLDDFDTKDVEEDLVAGKRVAVKPTHVDSVMGEIRDAPGFNLNNLQITGEANVNLYQTHARDIPRIEMPQIPATHGQVFHDALSEKGISAQLKEMDPRQLRATQNELDGPKVAGIYFAAKSGGFRKDNVLYASKDGDVLDGHHRWAAISVLNASGADVMTMQVMVIDTDIDTLLSIANTVSAQKLGSGEGRMKVNLGDKPTKPMPTKGGPWVWINGKWLEMITDTGDGIPESLDFGDADPKASRFNSAHDKLGKFANKSGVRIQAATGYDGLSAEGKKAVDDAEAKYGVTRAGMMNEIESKLTPENIAQGQKWYHEAHSFNRDLADRSGLSHEQVAAITAATSPRTPWPRNKVLAERVAMKWRDYPDMDPTFRDKRGRLDTPTQAAARKMGGGLVRTNLAPALVIARTADMGPGEQRAVIDKTLTGIKRRSFYNNMVEPTASQDITVDTWMMRTATNSSTRKGGLSPEDANDFLGEADGVTNGGAGYVSISEAVRGVATQRGLTPHEVQAAYWIAVSGSKDGARDG